MSQPHLFVGLALYVALAAASPTLQGDECRAYAEVRGLSSKVEEYQSTPYFFLENGRLTFRIGVARQADDALDLLWGAKHDQRAARVTVNGQALTMRAGGYDGFQWVRVPLPLDLVGDGYVVSLEPAGATAGAKTAFIAAVRLVPRTLAPADPWAVPTQARHVTFELPERIDDWPAVPSFAELPALERNARQAQRALRQCQLFVEGWLAKADPASGLIPENLTRGIDRWNGRNNAADNYPFMVLTAALTDRELFQGRLLEMLQAEQRLTSRVDRLGDVYRFSTRGFEYAEVDLARLIFDNSEYVKDGLMPLTEWLGPSPWSQRMAGVLDDIWKHAPVETPAGRIPSTDVEVNGEMMQVTSRFFWMTSRREYLDQAQRIADWYLLGDRHPTRDSDALKLRDHGCELISGLTEVYFACAHADQAKAEAYRQPLREILDCILKHGVDEHGMMFNAINPQTGQITRGGLSDNWGYNYNGFYTVYMVDGVEEYRAAVRHALSGLQHYAGYAWEGRSHDGYADSIESAINLYNREPIEVAAEWIDSQMRIMLAMQGSDGIIGGWHGDGNFARTAIMYALWKQQGATLQPWRDDLRLGAVSTERGVEFYLAADRPWQGRLICDAPRHRTIMHMPRDYPRINQFPEWFTVDKTKSYHVTRQHAVTDVSGQDLLDGLPVEVDPSVPLSITVSAD